MPIYEYECDECKKQFEELVRGSSEPKKCPKCGSTAIHRRLSVPSSPHSAHASSGCAARDAGACEPDSGHCCCGGCGCHHHH